MWARHSHAYVIQYPTWPVEWVQISVLLAYMDYWTTGSPDLVASFLSNGTQAMGETPSPQAKSLHDNTRLADADSTGLLNCSAQTANGCSTRPGAGHHIIDWDPPPSGNMFKFSSHLSVNNAFCLRGLLDLAEIAALLNKTAEATQYKTEATVLQKAMTDQMWNASAGMFCDGSCDTQPHMGVTTNTFTLFNDLIPTADVQKAWEQAAAYGLEGTGDYGAFIYLAALNKYAGDDGSATLHALTKCDRDSWCAEMETFNATMTRETWAGGTYSHVSTHAIYRCF